MIPDPITDERLKLVYPDLAVRWRRVAQDVFRQTGKQIRVNEGLRSIATQWQYWAKGRKQVEDGSWIVVDLKQVVTWAMPGNSLHLYGLAIDSIFLGSDPYLEKLPKDEEKKLWNTYGQCCKGYGLEWGGSWIGKKQDRPHCQITYGLNLQQIKDLYKIKGIQSVWIKCDQIRGGATP